MKEIRFNTGRSYSEHGQRIVARMDETGCVRFKDHDRMIEGEYRTHVPAGFSQTSVMRHYDQGAYASPPMCLDHDEYAWKE